MAKILISSLGTGQFADKASRAYRRASYKFEGEDKFYETPFVAAAISKRLQVDRLFLVGTSKSMWEEVYNYFAHAANFPFDYEYWDKLGEKADSFDISKPSLKIEEEELAEVNKAIDSYLKYINPSATGGSHCFIIDYGLNERELWGNFNVFMRIRELLKTGDEIYLDITHGFRSIPLFNYLMLDLLGILNFNNPIKLRGLFYGMLDVIRELNYAPIVDLSPLYKITLWSRAAYNFINFGNGYLLAELFEDENVKKDIRDFSDIVNINYIVDFKKKVDSLYGYLAEKESDEPVLRYMKPILQDFAGSFKGINTTGELQLALAKWYFENKRFAQGYICLAESIVTRILETYREKNGRISWEKENRDTIKNLIYNKLKEHQLPEYSEIGRLFDEISQVRNNIAHAGFIDNRDFQKDINEAQSYFNGVKKSVFRNPALKNLPDLYPLDLKLDRKYKRVL